jgi:hypothetical protein
MPPSPPPSLRFDGEVSFGGSKVLGEWFIPEEDQIFCPVMHGINKIKKPFIASFINFGRISRYLGSYNLRVFCSSEKSWRILWLYLDSKDVFLVKTVNKRTADYAFTKLSDNLAV